jgi:DNA-binding SARP family transcriptional activator
VLATRDEIGLGPVGDVWVDVHDFAAAVAARRLGDALALGHGELLPELEQDWVYAARDEHCLALAQVLEAVAARAEAAGDHAAAIWHTRRLAALDPLAEEHARALIRRLAAGGDRAAALTVYDRHRERLRTQLGVAPSAPTRLLLEVIRAEPDAEPESWPHTSEALALVV